MSMVNARDERRREEAKATRKIILGMSKSGMDIKDIAAITYLSKQEVGDHPVMGGTDSKGDAAKQR